MTVPYLPCLVPVDFQRIRSTRSEHRQLIWEKIKSSLKYSTLETAENFFTKMFLFSASCLWLFWAVNSKTSPPSSNQEISAIPSLLRLYQVCYGYSKIATAIPSLLRPYQDCYGHTKFATAIRYQLLRLYQVEKNTISRKNTDVKQLGPRIALGWVTIQVLYMDAVTTNILYSVQSQMRRNGASIICFWGKKIEEEKRKKNKYPLGN